MARPPQATKARPVSKVINDGDDGDEQMLSSDSEDTEQRVQRANTSNQRNRSNDEQPSGGAKKVAGQTKQAQSSMAGAGRNGKVKGSNSGGVSASRTKAGPSKPSTKRPLPEREPSPKGVEGNDDEDEEAEPEQTLPRATSRKRSPTNGISNNVALAKLQRELERSRDRTERQKGRLEAEIERLQKENEELRDSQEVLAQKFEELRRNRFTAPEDELKQAQELALANSETQQAMINELTARIHGLNDMTEEGASDILRLLTREETDGRFRDVKNNLMQKESELKDALTKVQELTDQVATLQSDLAAEKDHFQQEQERSRLLSRQQAVNLGNSSSPLVGRTVGSNARVPSDVKDATISFLEEMCSCAILHAKKEKSAESGAACWRFRCLFTINEAESLTFDIVMPPKDNAKPGDPDESQVLYTPLLDIGPEPTPEFKEKLDWLGGGFTFRRSQLHMLTQSLLKHLSAEDEEDEEEDEDDEMEE